MKKLVMGAIVGAAVLSGCSMTAPPYAPDVDNVSLLKAGKIADTKVGQFDDAPVASGNANPISLRGSKMHSPVNDSYSAYLSDALKQDLTLAGKYSDTSTTVVTGTLQKNDLDGASMSQGHGQIEARFIVTRAGQVNYDQVKSAETTWKSSFVGAVAIPAAVNSYPVLVQKLLNTLFSDPAFLNALK